MQTILQRWQRNIVPFSCPFITPAPLQPKLVPKSPQPPPDLPLEIWLEIFQFATYVHQHATIKPLDPFTARRTTTNAMGANTPSLAMRTKLALVLVSRSWRRVAIQITYRHIVIRSPARANAILEVLERSRAPQQPPESQAIGQILGYGEWTRHIEVFTYMRGSADIKFLQSVFKILRCCPNLHILSGNWIHALPVEFLRGLSGVLGPTLVGLYWNDIRSTSTPEFLGTFQSLRILDLRHLGGHHPILLQRPTSPRPTLPCVTDLIISSRYCSLRVATILDLPNLHNLTLRTAGWESSDDELLTAFLEVHGQSLINVDLPPPTADSELDPENAPIKRNVGHITPDAFLAPDVCPKLESLTYSCTANNYTTHPHPNLRRIGIRGVTADCLYPDKPSFAKGHLTALTGEKYPCLQLVQTVGFLVEAHGDSMIKDVCIWWVERFEKMGILFLDGEGVMWVYTEPEVLPESLKELDMREHRKMGAKETKEKSK